ncbi:MAG: TolC family protein [Deltaproteobacteria bacterium]|nr:TolC family protein [Deltaproteobacteria bacterium]
MKKIVIALSVCGLLFSGLAATPAVVCAEEYTLEELYRIALARSEILKVAEENLTIAEIGKDKAYSFLLPRVTATGGVTQYTEKKYNSAGSLIQPETAASWGLQVSETVSLSGRELTALEISKQFITKSTHDVTAIREDYLLRFVAASYYNVLMAKKVLDIADSNLERLTKYRDAAEKRLRIGEVTKTALLRAEGELSGAQSDRLQAKNGLELAMAVLARNVGIREAFTLRERVAAAADILTSETYKEKAFAMRADLKSLEVQKQIAADQIKYAEGAFWPTVSAAAGYAGADQYPSPSSLNRDSFYGGVALNFPFFEGGLRRAEISEARARERQAALFYEDLKKGIGIEVETAYLDLLTQKGILQFLDDQLVFARDNYQAVARQYDFGLSNSLDVLDANNLLVSAETKVASAAYNFRLALLRMKKATGTLLRNEP